MVSNPMFKKFIIAILIFFSIPAFAQKGISMFLDYARFRYDREVSYLEIYYMVNDANVISKEKELFLNIQIVDTRIDSQLATQDIKMTFNEELDPSQTKLGMVKTLLPEGHYTLRLMGYLNDLSQRLDTVSIDLNIKSFVNEKITLSDLELSNNIIPNSNRTENSFYKNTMEVIPNPSRFFTKDNRLYYYVELYNLNMDSQTDNNLQIELVIADEEGQIRESKKYVRPQKTESLVEVGAFDISKMESGLYALIFAVTDTAADYSVYRRSQFYVQNPDVVAEDGRNKEREFMQSRYFQMGNEELDERFAQASHIATKEEINIYNSLANVEGKKNFLFEFWQRRTKERPDFEDDYYERVEYANQQYGTSGVEGWNTDMGRVYIVYGEPDQIERNASTPGTNPYEIWHYYDIQGGVEFDFVDDLGFGQYKLVNSTHRNEVREPDWIKWYVQK
jgi:GWxTD domain-containing protein